MLKKAILTFFLTLCVPVFAEAGDNTACKKDYQTLCGGKGHVIKCLRKNKDKISKECQSEMESSKKAFMEKHKERKELRVSMKEACKKDPDCVAKWKEMKDKKAQQQ